MSAPLKQVWYATDVRGSMRGREWVGVVAVLCLAFTTALTALLHVGVATLDGALREDLGADREEIVHIETAAGVSAAEGRRALEILHRSLGDAKRSPVHRTLAVLPVSPRDRLVEVLGVSAALPQLQTMAIREGRWFSAREEREERPVAVVGRGLVDSMYQGVRPRRLRLSRVTFDVIGVVESGALAPVSVDRAVMVTPGILQRLALHEGGPREMLVSLSRDPRIADVHDMRRVLERRYGWFAGRLSMASSREQLGEASRLSEALQTGAAGLSTVLVAASLAAVVALMLTIARGHARSVGVTRALGASRAQVVAQGFLIGIAVGGLGVTGGLTVAVVVRQLLPMMFDVPAISTGTLLLALVKAGAPPLIMAASASVVCFVQLSRRAPAALLA